MKRFFRYAALSLGAVLLFGSCTKVDDMLGLDFIPDNEELTLSIDTLYKMQTYGDTLSWAASTRLGVGIIGREVSPLYGTTQASAMLQYAPSYFSKSGFYGKHNPTIDSVFIYLKVSNVGGDTLQTQIFDVYKVTEKLAYDSVYYSNMDPMGKYDAQPLFSMTMKNSAKATHKFKLVDAHGAGGTATPQGLDFFKSLVSADTTLYVADTAFLAKFNGLYIAPRDGNRALYTIKLEDTFMTLFTHNYKDASSTAITNRKDTVAVTYSFADDPSYYYPTSINLVKHDYTGTQVAATQDSLQSFDVVYYQSLMGIMPKIKFGDEFIAEIDALKLHAGVQYKNIVVNKAQLIIKSKNVQNEPMITYLDKAPSRLGSYLNYSKYTPIADYYYTYENNGYAIPYGGYYNRSGETFAMDISVFVQRMIRSKDAPRSFSLGSTPEVGSAFGYRNIALKGYHADKRESIKIILTYTLIK